jgi:glucokinase
MRDLVTTMPVSVIMNPDAGLVGAAVHAMAATAAE